MSELDQAVAAIRERSSLEPEVGLVLGSGLGGLADAVEERVEIPYGEIPGWPLSTAIGHAGVLVLGSVDGVRVAVLRGRAHLYEGVSADRAVFGIRVLGKLGMRTLVVTNAAGAIRETFRPGQLVLISDHVNLQGTSPLVGPNDDALGPRFPDMSDAYDRHLREAAEEAASRLGLDVGEGVWLGAGAKILDGVTIGNRAIVGAGAVVRNAVPAGATAVGIPARLIVRAPEG